MNKKTDIILLVIVFFSVVSSFYSIRKDILLFKQSGHPDVISLYGGRFEEAKRLIPKHEIVGYINENNAPLVRHDGKGVNEYYLARYFLCPRVLEQDVLHKYVVKNTAKGVEVFIKKDK